MIKLLIDTDIGTDVDDALAIGLALRSPEVDLVGVTTVYGDVLLRARMVHKLLALAGRPEVPVRMGVRLPLLRRRSVYWLGHEGVGLLDSADESVQPNPQPATDFISDMARQYPGELVLAPIGPLTNIATALTRDPELPKLLKSVVIMGGVVRTGALSLPWTEHNIHCDPEAAAVVFSALPWLTMVPLDVTTKVTIDQAALARIQASPSLLASAIANQLSLYPRFAARGRTYLHDPLAIALTFDPSFCQLVEMRVDVETNGEFTAGATVAVLPGPERANAAVAVEVDVPRFEKFVVDRLSADD